ncbi:bifunctional tRNA (adenosine(37)-C2)-methyltransferase TrmG/ribosomal RNA large subunit methyltransferase RlmN [Buchnera aphidicola]|jgi:23S rRNA (adenine2503-C2)-methyltransferase|uniref:Dual-specificity RNA methyltransferase RlmN n=1 Tax=Buchnera aphidicola subsp. Schizaphis graminum (strain Sg) TaxID=198804 RepID=RLMN_BUCAP|nr:bifunctional tRNA (adenosine(37)-C2)-methyltransferase TrmG/ribosomal RNA large subunit methyltransferase RlmN [Buchnera aphidicola]Q8K9P5.1 RecName: Full=Dual-specificity RNA methyltransferase RlmN; AltName: Full=23S rRNA (adenine(2503)-C(2))-methyltransferase; AltName: Full=23S rRNA m2A2503 methyltransferase; AltName: Full=Ribosomal RNA large subunit methyltransferase N; AltName: Full=tRNA (adenine(37)-C(2))-methyltransferase; AltName: Full=tRNA m2A37 methyltransferase [Buchnera aphidicola st
MHKSINIKNISDDKINLLDLNRKEIEIFLLSLGAKKFVTDQLMKWIYNRHCNNFNLMSNLKKDIRKKLNERSYIFASNFIEEKISYDGTVKWITSIDKQKIETIYIPEKKRATLCVSSQIGCSLKCKFCATGQQGFNRNLKVSEIISQIWQANKILKEKKNNSTITNIVFMGMGEPLLNLNNVISAIKIILDKNGFGLSKRRITLSTSGIVPALNKLIKKIDVSLAISLHAPNDFIRNSIMPINMKYNIKSFLNSVSKYLKHSHANRGGVTVEYVMLRGINDLNEHAEELGNILKKIPSKINLIPWNFFKNANFICSSKNRINIFANILRKKGFNTTIRKNRGQDIGAACGQLTGDIVNRIKN